MSGNVIRFPLDPRRALMRNQGHRWSKRTLAAILTYPSDFRDTIEEWIELMDLVDTSITRAEITSSSLLATRQRGAMND